MRGFTMVELIMVIVIIGILAAVVGPRFFDRQAFDERLYFEQSLTAVRYAQKLALSSGCQIRVWIDDTSDQNGYALSYADTGVCAPSLGDPAVKNPSGGNYAATLPSGVRVQQALDVTFNSRGYVVAVDASVCPNRICTTEIGGFRLAVHADTGFVEANP